jgi:hypothetical protein
MAMTLITTNDGSDVASSSFTSSIDSTYKLYIFKFYDVNPATDAAEFTFQFNAVGASGFNETITSTMFKTAHAEADGGTSLEYKTAEDQAQGTAYNYISRDGGNASDESTAGELFLFNPSNTTYVKHFYGTANVVHNSEITNNMYYAGYINTTAAIDEVDFKMSTGNMDAVIKMYGVG